MPSPLSCQSENAIKTRQLFCLTWTPGGYPLGDVKCRSKLDTAIADPSETVAASTANWPFLRLAQWRMKGVARGTRDPGRWSDKKPAEKSSGDG
jgi:hypothetical protein